MKVAYKKLAVHEYALRNPVAYAFNIKLPFYSEWGTEHYNSIPIYFKRFNSNAFLLPIVTGPSSSIESRGKTIATNLRKVKFTTHEWLNQSSFSS